MLLGSAFGGEGIQVAAIVFDSRFAATQEPEAPMIVEITGVAGAMPDAPADSEFGFLVADAVEIAAQDVIAVNDDFAGLIGGQAVFGETGFGIIGDGATPLLANYFETDLWHG